MIRFLFVTVLTVLISACGAPPANVETLGACELVLRPNDFSPAERGAIERAASRWTDTLAAECSVSEGEHFNISRALFAKPEESWTAATNQNGEIFVWDTDDIVNLEEYITHEIGHRLGIEHTAPPNYALVSNDINRTNCITRADLDQICMHCIPECEP